MDLPHSTRWATFSCQADLSLHHREEAIVLFLGTQLPVCTGKDAGVPDETKVISGFLDVFSGTGTIPLLRRRNLSTYFERYYRNV